MKKIDFNELIEKAFCEGYEYAQKEFSEEKENKEEEDQPKKKKKSGKSGLLGYGAYAAGIGLNAYAGQKFLEDLEDEGTKESKGLYDKLKENIKSRNVKIDDDKSFYVQGNKNAAYSPEMKGLRNIFARGIKGERKDGKKDSVWAKVKKTLNEANGGINVGKRGFKIDKSMKGRADILAHEMGHEHYMDGEGKGIKSVGGVLHSLRNPAVMIGGGLAAIHSGIKKEKLEREGKKESKWNKYKSVILPGIASAALVGSEAAAYIHGYNQLKKMGASEELLKDTRKKLGNALGTYAGLGLANIGSGLIGRAAGKKMAKGYYALKDKFGKKKEQENKKEED